MNIVLLSPHFPDHHFRFAYHLKALGAKVLGVADEPVNFLDGTVKDSLTQYYQVPDMHDYDALLRICGKITHDHGRIHYIESLNEYWLETEAALRTDFNVPGYKNHDIMTIKKKSEMKAVFQSLGLAVPKGRVVSTLDDAFQFLEEIQYPAVLKPDIGVGASHTYKIENDEQLIEVFQKKTPYPYIMEEYISGKICTYDGLADRDGKPVFYTSMIYSDGVMEVVNSDNHVYYYTLRDVPQDIREAGEKMLQAFGVRERFFHFEFFRRHDSGELVALEVNMRPSGGPTIDMFNYANDFDLYKEWANVLVHNHFNAPVARKYLCAYVSRKAWKTYVHTHQEIFAKLNDILVYHGQLSPIFRKAMGDEYFLLRSPDEDKIIQAAQYIQDLA